MAVRYGRYEVLYKLGQGAMAQVFLAKDPVLSRFVAVKVLHGDLAARKDVLQRFFNEARTVAVIRNPHVVEVFDFGQEGKDLYLVMEFVDGMSLHGLMRRALAPRAIAHEPWAAPGGEGAPLYEPMDPAVAAALMCQASEGLAIAAQHGVVHRDLKPENLMLNSQGYLKISDFGIAHVQDESITKTGAVLGSPLYMSPEQARGIKPITAQADMFSLGAVFYACLVGHPPFRGRTVNELFRAIASEPHAPLWRLRPGLDPAMGNLVDTLLRKRPEERGGGPRWLHRQLKAYLMALGVMDPAELAAGYLKELEARGVHTTWKLDDRNGTIPMTVAATQRDASQAISRTRPGPAYPPGTLPAAALPVRSGPRPEKMSTGRRSALAIASGLAILGLAVGLWSLGWNSRERPSRVADHPAAPAQAVPAASAPAGAAGGNVYVTQAIGGGGPSAASASANEYRAPAPAATPRAPKPGSGIERRGSDARGKEPEAALILKSSPPFADAYVDGRYVGATPVRLEPILPGRHRLAMKSARLPGFDTVMLVRPGIQALKVHLEAAPSLRMAATPVEGD